MTQRPHPSQIRAHLIDAFTNYHSLRHRLVLDGIIVGIVAGTLSTLYRVILSKMEDLRMAWLDNPDTLHIVLWFVILAVSALVVARLLKWAPYSGGSGIPQVEGELLGAFEMRPVRVMLSKIVGGSLTNLSGLSVGREGPSIQIGAVSGKLCGNILNKPNTEKQYMVTAGAAAGLAAAFNAPISGCLFPLEEIHKDFNPLVFVPAMLSAVIADFIAKHIFGIQPVFIFHIDGTIPLNAYGWVVLTGLLVGLLGVLFNVCLLKGQDFYKKLPISNKWSPMIAFIGAGILAFAAPFLLGGGHHVIENVSVSNTAIWMLLIMVFGKLLFTAFSYGSGAQGGIFLPLLVIGGIGGFAFYKIVFSASLIAPGYGGNFILLGMAAMMASVVRAPILAIILVTEMSGNFTHILGLSVAVICAYIVAETLRNPPIYDSLLERMLPERPDVPDLARRVIREYYIGLDSEAAGKKVKDLGLPKRTLITSIDRAGEQWTPTADSLIKAGDRLYVFCVIDSIPEVDACLKPNVKLNEEE